MNQLIHDNLPLLKYITGNLYKKYNWFEWTFDEALSIVVIQTEELLKKFDPTTSTLSTYLFAYLPGRVEYEYLRHDCGKRIHSKTRKWYSPIKGSLADHKLLAKPEKEDVQETIEKLFNNPHLSKIQKEILSFKAQGRSNVYIASIFNIHRSAVQYHIKQIRKLYI